MYTLMRNTIAKVFLVIAVSICITAGSFMGLVIGLYGSYGLYDKTFDEFTAEQMEYVANEKAYSVLNQYINYVDQVEDSETDADDKDSHHDDADTSTSQDTISVPVLSKKFDSDNYPEYDFVITINGKEVCNTYTKNDDEYAFSGAASSEWDDNDITVTAYCKNLSEFAGQDLETVSRLELLYNMRYVMLGIIAFCAIAALLGFIALMKGAGKREEDDDIHDRKFWDHIPADLYLAIDIAIVSILILLGTEATRVSIMFGVIVSGALGIICCIIALAWFMSMAVQIKQKRLIRETIIARVLSLIGVGISALPIIWKVMVPAAILWVILMMCGLFSNDGFVAFLMFIIATALLVGTCYVAIMLRRLENGGKEIASGNTSHVISTSKMFGAMKKHAETLNNINKGVDAAVTERMKSERFKTELITNVSHDIKTPLTSIISYTDLLEKEELDNETAREYIEIIARNAQRLKKLTSDIVSASKASTGNIKVERGECNIGIMLNQALGEYEEKMNDLGLSPVVSIPEDDITVLADGEHSWRILDNIMNNICKYAQSGSRVYMDVFEDGDMACISFKNISAQPLNISADELMERFVRGDESRNTEGSGLGLSIAQDLARLQGGAVNLSIDGDLFKVIVSFEKA